MTKAVILCDMNSNAHRIPILPVASRLLFVPLCASRADSMSAPARENHGDKIKYQAMKF
ncbi:hypothetical protein [Georgfuchsia toluolica]|uniref:hypothetical protein n=1 Tax=Georgfuchsia toluolica TaxID=424218 RepID=UPI001C73BEA6|nr:hypothetical protein [Georgfuchsia toluolica]